MWANLPQKTLDLLVPPHKRKWEGKMCPLLQHILSLQGEHRGCMGMEMRRRQGWAWCPTAEGMAQELWEIAQDSFC